MFEEFVHFAHLLMEWTIVKFTVRDMKVYGSLKWVWSISPPLFNHCTVYSLSIFLGYIIL